jgi:hypothetical protein
VTPEAARLAIIFSYTPIRIPYLRGLPLPSTLLSMAIHSMN